MRVVRLLSFLFSLLLPLTALGADPEVIFKANQTAMVRLEVHDANGGVVETGSGFLISRTGYIATVAHLRPGVGPNPPEGKLFGSLNGGRDPEIELELLDIDGDIALWHVPPGYGCLPSVDLSVRIPNPAEPATVLGFNADRGLGPTPVSIRSTYERHGWYQADAPLMEGSSGSAVFDDTGAVIGLVQGGVGRGRQPVDIIPASRLLLLAYKYNIGNENARADRECPSVDAVDLFDPQFSTRRIVFNKPEPINIGKKLREGQTVYLCLQTQSPLPSGWWFNTLDYDNAPVAPYPVPLVQFQKDDRPCKLPRGLGNGELYGVQAPREDNYKVVLNFRVGSSLFSAGNSGEANLNLVIGYGVLRTP